MMVVYFKNHTAVLSARDGQAASEVLKAGKDLHPALVKDAHLLFQLRFWILFKGWGPRGLDLH